MGRSNGYCSVTMFLGFCARKVTARPFIKSTWNNRSRSSRMRVSLFLPSPIVKQSAPLFCSPLLLASSSFHSFSASSVTSVLIPFLLFPHAILSPKMETDLQFMQEALAEARASAFAGEVPIGAILVHDGKILARSGNRTIRDNDPTAHACFEILSNPRLNHQVAVSSGVLAAEAASVLQSFFAARR